MNIYKDGIKLIGSIELKVYGADGKLKYARKMKNTITNAGKALMASLAGDASAVPFTYLEVGTSNTATSASHTALQAAITDSGLARHAATVTRVTTTQTNDTLNLNYEWTASGSKTIEEVGLFNDPTAGTMLGRCLTGSCPLISGDKINMTYKVQFA